MKILEDIPLYSIRQDELHREQLVDFVYDSLMVSAKDNHPCRCIGIYGKWGEGKSSFMNLIKERLHQRIDNTDNKEKTDVELKIVVHDFNPWLANNHETLMWDFFNTISKDTTAEIKDMLARYSGLVNGGTLFIEAVSAAAMAINPFFATIGLVTKYAAKGIRSIWNWGQSTLEALGNKTLSERKKEISNSFKESGLHRFIFIDDIDRLDKEEIHTVFRLIREVADFYNVTYIIAMDPDIVAKSLSAYFGDGNICDGSDFIDKIIQVPIQLPMVQQSTVKEIFKKKFGDLWKSYHCGSAQDLDKLSQNLSHILLTQRQIIRYINQISFVIPALEGEVNMQELCLLEAIKIVDVQAYLRIANSRMVLLKESDNDELVIDEQAEDKQIQEQYENALDDIVRDINSPIKEYIREMIDKLFSSDSLNYQKDLDDKRLCTGIYFAKYFIQAVPENVISDHCIENAYRLVSTQKCEELSSIFNDWYNRYGIEEVKRVVLTTINKFDDSLNRSIACQALIKSILHTDIVNGYGYTLIDTSNNFTTFVSKVLLTRYLRKTIGTQTDVGNDDNDIYKLLSTIYEDKRLPMTFLMDLHARVCDNFNLKNYDFATTLIRRFNAMSYHEQQKYSKLKLRPIYETWSFIDRKALDDYLKKAFESVEFNSIKFLSTMIENKDFSQDVTTFIYIFGDEGVEHCKKMKESGDASDGLNRIQAIISTNKTIKTNK